MKKLLILVLILWSLSIKAQTNVYHPFPDSNATWNIAFYANCWWNGTLYENYSITITGDTMIGGQLYHKLLTPFVQSFTSGSCGAIHMAGYKGAFREDTAIRKVFYIPPIDSIEQLLYDFTMEVGDTVKGFLESFASPNDIVQSIDSILVGNNYHKKWIINTCYNISIIEGVGSTYGLNELTPGCITDFPDYSISCFQQNGQPLYPNTSINCELITSVNSYENFSRQITIYPNPFTESTTIEFENNNSENYTLEIYNNLGQKVRTIENIRTNKIKIERGNFNSGIYFFQLKNNSGIRQTGKLVVE